MLIVAGAMLIADAGADPGLAGADLRRLRQAPAGPARGKLDDQANLTQLQLRALQRLRSENRRMAFLARVLRRKVKGGDPIGRIKIKRMGSTSSPSRGPQPDDLRKGPGPLPGHAVPGIRGTVGDRRPPHDLPGAVPQAQQDEPGGPDRPGDALRRFIYRTELRKIVSPNAYAYVTARKGYDRLALTACNPLYSAKQRIVVFARLVGARRPWARRAARRALDAIPPHMRVSPGSSVQGRAENSRGRFDRTIIWVFAEDRMEATRTMKLDTLKARIGNAEYEVDVQAVADAIVQRLLAARGELRQAARTSTGATRSAAAGCVVDARGAVLVPGQLALRAADTKRAPGSRPRPPGRSTSAGPRPRPRRGGRAARRRTARSPRRRWPPARPRPRRAGRPRPPRLARPGPGRGR